MADEEQQAPETPPVEETQSAPEPAESESEATEQTQPEPEPPRARMIPLDVMTRELTPLRQRNRELERQLTEANELLRRFNQHPADTQHQPRTQAPTPAAADQSIEQRAAELNFQRDARRVIEAGMSTYGPQVWQGACNLMDGLGLNSQQFVAAIMEVAGTERTHQVFHAIAEDPERAARIASMLPVRQIAEISRIAEQMGSKTQMQTTAVPKPARTVSRAPEPAPRVNAGTRTARDWRTDDVSDEEFSRAWDEHMKNRVVRR